MTGRTALDPAPALIATFFLEYRRKQALWAAGQRPHYELVDGWLVAYCYGCNRPDSDCQCGHGANWLGPWPDELWCLAYDQPTARCKCTGQRG